MSLDRDTAVLITRAVVFLVGTPDHDLRPGDLAARDQLVELMRPVVADLVSEYGAAGN